MLMRVNCECMESGKENGQRISFPCNLNGNETATAEYAILVQLQFSIMMTTHRHVALTHSECEMTASTEYFMWNKNDFNWIDPIKMGMNANDATKVCWI